MQSMSDIQICLANLMPYAFIKIINRTEATAIKKVILQRQRQGSNTEWITSRYAEHRFVGAKEGFAW